MCILLWWRDDGHFSHWPLTIICGPIVKMCLTVIHTFSMRCSLPVHRLWTRYNVSGQRTESHLIMNRCRYVFHTTEANWKISFFSDEHIQRLLRLIATFMGCQSRIVLWQFRRFSRKREAVGVWSGAKRFDLVQNFALVSILLCSRLIVNHSWKLLATRN